MSWLRSAVGTLALLALIALAPPAAAQGTASATADANATGATAASALAGPDAAAQCALAEQRGTRRSDAHEDLDALLWMQRSAEYQANTRSLYHSAARQLQQLAQGHRNGRFSSALLDGASTAPGTTPGTNKGPRSAIVIMDLDETVLDNSLLQGRLLRDARVWDQSIWECWIAARQAALVPGAELLFRTLAANGLRAWFISNRQCAARSADGESCPQKQDTLANLNRLLAERGIDYRARGEEILMYDDSEPGSTRLWSGEKGPRRQWLARQHDVLMLFGDDLGDFITGARSSSAAQRAALLAKPEVEQRWGTQWFMLPNPVYGSWTGALGNGGIDSVESFRFP
ncbi:MAG: HAD family acid phosphatase [Steroidobacteraceae bacterium]